MCIHCMVPATMMRSNSGMSWDFHHRRTKFFMSRVRSLPKHFLCSVTFLGTKTTMLLAPFVACSPYLFYAKNICHLDSLLEPIKNIVNPILLGWKTHITIFFTIVVAAIHITNALSSQKWLYIHPSNFFLEWLLTVLTQNQVASRIILLQLMRSIRLSRYWRLMEGYKVIFESWGEAYRSCYSNVTKIVMCVVHPDKMEFTIGFWSVQASCKDGRCFWSTSYEASQQHGGLGSKKIDWR